MKIYRYHNGDTCPCCGQVITGKTEEELAEFSVLIYGFASTLGLAEWLRKPEQDAIEITPWELRQRLSGETEET